MKFLQFIILSFLSISTFSQAVFTKDGVELGDRSNLLIQCIGGFDKDDIDLNGIMVNKYKYCSCVCDNLIPEVTSDEILMAMKTNDLSSLFLKDQNLKIIMKCVDGNMKLEDDFVFKESEYSDRSKGFRFKIVLMKYLIIHLTIRGLKPRQMNTANVLLKRCMMQE